MFSKKVLQYEEHRWASGPLPLGPAPIVSSGPYKLPSSVPKSLAKSWDHLWSLECHQRAASSLKALAGNGVVSGVDPNYKPPILFGTGRPAAELYPLRSMSLTHLNTLGPDNQDGSHTDSRPDASRKNVFDISVAMNYGFSAGSAQLLRYVTEHVELIHDPPYEDWECCLTSGTTAAFETAFRMFCNRGDYLLVEEYTYAGALESARPLGINIVGIEMDNEGITPSSLESTLLNWPVSKGKRPSILYTVPSGQNPTTVTQSLPRKKAIYAIAEQYDLYIIEDDPYYFLQLSDSSTSFTQLSPSNFFSTLPPSYLSLDVSGRVLRLDSTAKILAPGLRCAWLTASAPVVAKFRSYHEATTVAPGGLSQLALYTLLDVDWGHEGFMTWLASLSAEYSRRNSALLEACERWLPRSICTWERPKAGMFLWVAIKRGVLDRLERSGKQLGELEAMVYTKAKENGVVVSMGSWFVAERGVKRREMFFRFTFAAAKTEEFEDGVKGFADAVNSALRLGDVGSEEEGKTVLAKGLEGRVSIIATETSAL